MNATLVATDVPNDVDDLITAVYLDAAAIRVARLAKGLGIREYTIRRAIADGELSALRVSERGMVVFRESARRWLASLQRGES